MDPRTRVINVLKHNEIDRFPRTLWTLPNINVFKKEQYRDLCSKIEFDIGNPDIGFAQSRYQKGSSYRMPGYTDEFGCTFDVAEEGVVGEVKKAIFADFDALDSYRMPNEILESIDKNAVSEQCKKSSRFMIANTHIRPFERMQFMRGTEDLFCDLASGEPRVEQLIRMLHEFYLRELDIVTDTACDAFSFMDDWGTQISLLISPVLWRQLFKPLYKEYCDMAHSKGKFVFFHSDGFIESIYPDLVEIGVDAINSQLFCMDIEKLVDLYGDKICFWGEIDRQTVLPFGTTRDVEKAVDRVADAVIKKNKKRTGAIAQCEWNAFDPYENMLTVFKRWDTK
ncbi:MAG: uroporphyrinogen decarboxylase family protein [Clostridia bacterium]